MSAPAQGPSDPSPGAERRETQVLGAVESLVDSLLEDFDVVELLTDLTEQCADLLAVESAGLLLGGPDARLRLVTATSARTTDLELLQLQADEGPCLDCFRTGRSVSVADLHEAGGDRWPVFAAAAVAAGFTAVHAVPMRAAGSVLGTLGLFGTAPGALTASDLAVGQTLAHVASVAILQERAPAPASVGPRLMQVLSRQIVVEQAKGLVHDRLGISVEEALAALRAYARRRGQHLSDLCRELMTEPEQRADLLAGLRADATPLDATTPDTGGPGDDAPGVTPPGEAPA